MTINVIHLEQELHLQPFILSIHPMVCLGDSCFFLKLSIKCHIYC